MAQHRHKRETNARRFPRPLLLAAPLASLATVSVVTAGVLAGGTQPSLPSEGMLAGAGVAAASAGEREPLVSRSERRTVQRHTEAKLVAQSTAYERRVRARAAREAAKVVAAAEARGTLRWTTAPLNLWSSADEDARNLGELDEATKVLVTGRTAGGRVELVLDGRLRWVTAGYLSDEKPVPVAAGLSMAPCPDGSVENGLTANAVAVYRSVCHAFPQITSYGGWDNHGEHASGRALDIMTSDVALGTAIAEFLHAHAAELHLYDILWRQRIWTPVRAAEGWRALSDRGSATANHYDHVHVSTY
ncbi:MAG TPA: mucin-2 protein [Nocardioides sp.]|uniref:mucin-2 protein n=1 Tax=Nocardioides sp. TaxID=35761 RepID=UPI002BCE7CD2|nr:mucin-2 protein [Nocardioides sp.]HQR25576.1 mucin-2 protein [Nocardioides sp.]